MEIGKSIDPDNVYRLLYNEYGPQGWWPIVGRAGTRGYDSGGYHKGDYRLPRKPDEMFEIMTGAVLTQNTAWTNVHRALVILAQEKYLHVGRIMEMDEGKLAELVRSSGYYNQKAKKLKYLAAACLENNWLKNGAVPRRQDLLSVWGVGEETADSILLYVFGSCVFVVDAYGKRLFYRLGITPKNTGYHALQQLFHTRLEKRRELYNEYHALIVEHAKQHCRTKPRCEGCVLADYCPYCR
ncbi:MAG: hypothetical protein P8107_12765 [Spirochaetia bacterium]|jgi:endonuclease-3 related protein